MNSARMLYCNKRNNNNTQFWIKNKQSTTTKKHTVPGLTSSHRSSTREDAQASRHPGRGGSRHSPAPCLRAGTRPHASPAVPARTGGPGSTAIPRARPSHRLSPAPRKRHRDPRYLPGRTPSRRRQPPHERRPPFRGAPPAPAPLRAGGGGSGTSRARRTKPSARPRGTRMGGEGGARLDWPRRGGAGGDRGTRWRLAPCPLHNATSHPARGARQRAAPRGRGDWRAG